MSKSVIICIYRIRNLVNGKFYIGSTLDWHKRKIGHLGCLRNRRHSNRYLQRAWDKYGESNFVFEVFERLDGFDNQSLRDVEQWWINNTNCLSPDGYNLSRSAVGYEFTETHKQNMTLAQKGKEHHFSPESKARAKENCAKAREVFRSDEHRFTAYRERMRATGSTPEAIESKRRKNAEWLSIPENREALAEKSRLSLQERIALGFPRRPEEWKKKFSETIKEYKKRNPQSWTNGSERAVSQIHNEEVIATYPSAIAAARSVCPDGDAKDHRCVSGMITAVCRGRRAKCQGFGWAYA